MVVPLTDVSKVTVKLFSITIPGSFFRMRYFPGVIATFPRTYAIDVPWFRKMTTEGELSPSLVIVPFEVRTVFLYMILIGLIIFIVL